VKLPQEQKDWFTGNCVLRARTPPSFNLWQWRDTVPEKARTPHWPEEFMYIFEPMKLGEFECHPVHEAINPDTIFQTPEWLRFLVATQGGEPVIVLVKAGSGSTVGYFSGLLVSKFGVRILGSPFPGWSTSYMGFTLAEDISHRAVLESFVPWAFANIPCSHIEVMDRRICEQDVSATAMQFRLETGYEIELRRSEGELFQQMAHQCRTNVRKAMRCGLAIEEAHDSSFADDYYDQLQEVFGKRQLIPTFPRARVSELVRRFGGDPKCLFLRARNEHGECVATTIMLGGRRVAYLWGAASWQKYQMLRPNELLYWTIIKRAAAIGMRCLDMGGAGDYKAKYGGTPISVPWLRVSRSALIPTLRNLAERMFVLRQQVRRSLHVRV
jgi:Acetyltransferase (GNAT) domain